MDPGYYTDYHRWEQEHWWFIARRRIIDRILGRYASAAPTSILEVGCGTGGMAGLLAKYGPVTAIDVEPDVAPYVRTSYRAFAVTDAGAMAIRDGMFGLVVALDVLEHTDDDASTLREVRRVCKPGGLVVVSVPAFQFLWGRQDAINHHRRRYRRRQLDALVRGANLTVLKLSYFNTLLFPPVAAVRLLMSLLPAATPATKRSDFGMFETGVLAKLALAMFSLESRVLPFVSLPVGVSLLCVARR